MERDVVAQSLARVRKQFREEEAVLDKISYKLRLLDSERKKILARRFEVQQELDSRIEGNQKASITLTTRPGVRSRLRSTEKQEYELIQLHKRLDHLLQQRKQAEELYVKRLQICYKIGCYLEILHKGSNSATRKNWDRKQPRKSLLPKWLQQRMSQQGPKSSPGTLSSNGNMRSSESEHSSNSVTDSNNSNNSTANQSASQNLTYSSSADEILIQTKLIPENYYENFNQNDNVEIDHYSDESSVPTFSRRQSPMEDLDENDLVLKDAESAQCDWPDSVNSLSKARKDINVNTISQSSHNSSDYSGHITAKSNGSQLLSTPDSHMSNSNNLSKFSKKNEISSNQYPTTKKLKVSPGSSNNNSKVQLLSSGIKNESEMIENLKKKTKSSPESSGKRKVISHNSGCKPFVGVSDGKKQLGQIDFGIQVRASVA